MSEEVRQVEVEVVEDVKPKVDALVPVNGEFPSMVRQLNDALVGLSVEFERARDELIETVQATVEDIRDRNRRVADFRAALKADMDRNFSAITAK